MTPYPPLAEMSPGANAAHGGPVLALIPSPWNHPHSETLRQLPQTSRPRVTLSASQGVPSEILQADTFGVTGGIIAPQNIPNRP